MPLKLMYITNNPNVAVIAQRYGVDRVFIDLETLGKEKRQGNINSVKSHHSIEDIKRIAPLLYESEMLVRVNPINPYSKDEIEKVIKAGADLIMLPMWKSSYDIKKFLNIVDKRAKTILLLETKEAVECIDEILDIGGFDEIHIGLNDLHLSYKLTFMFELLSNGVVERLCNKIRSYGIPYGFGGIARIGEGLIPAERILMEHYLLGSTRVILSRSFCDTEVIKDEGEIEYVFKKSITELKEFEKQIILKTKEDFLSNRIELINGINKIVEYKKEEKNGLLL